jgi:1,2-diacylglycerol 3-beta-glucosyltransferase
VGFSGVLAALLGATCSVAVGAPLAYLYVLALAAIPYRHRPRLGAPRHRFAIAIPAHNEENVIRATVAALRAIDYPPQLFDVHVVADHCSDRTADAVREAGATAHERNEGARGSKGAALQWLFEKILADEHEQADYDAVVVFDADTLVAPDFLRIMDARLSQGDQVIQGQHRIRNPEDGWFPALTWAMFLVDNRLQNLGRANLGWSAKNMGDSICFRAGLLRRLGWGEGLTEDYAFRQRLLLEDVRIAYEPNALGYGEAVLTWSDARAQRARWLRGTHDATRQYGRVLIREAVRRRSLPLLDGALQAILPSYSTLTLASVALWAWQVIGYLLRRSGFGTSLAGWTAVTAAVAAYPLIGLALERAPARAYLVMLTGPFFVVWRTWLAVTSRFGGRQVVWVRTPRRTESSSSQS